MVQSDLELLKILPVLVCRKEQVHENFMDEKLKQLGKSLKVDVQILKGIDVYEEKDVPLLARASLLTVYGTIDDFRLSYPLSNGAELTINKLPLGAVERL